MVALGCVVAAGLFIAVEQAIRGVSVSRAERLLEDGRPGAKRLLTIASDPAPFINTAYLVSAILEVTAVVLVTVVIAAHTEVTWLRVLWPTLIMSAVSFVLLGVAPRTLGRQHADTVALTASGPLSIITTVLGPIGQLMILIGNILTPGKGYSDGPFTSEEELRELVDRAGASEVIEDSERLMIHSVFELGDTIVKEVMVPRTDMVSIERGKTLRQGISLALRSGFSRIPVAGEDLDDIVGVLYLKDMIRRTYDNPSGQGSETVDSIMRKPIFCPDSKPVDQLLREMQRTRSHVVVVVDEFGGTAGLATIEDILEEIVGEIVDEYDQEVPPFVELGPDRFRVWSRLSLDALGDLFGMELEDDDVETVLGLMSKELNKVPIPGSLVEYEGLVFVAERGVGRRKTIRTVVVSRVTDSDPADAATDVTTAIASETAHAEGKSQ